jgi:hypothetical protein
MIAVAGTYKFLHRGPRKFTVESLASDSTLALANW